MHKHARSYRCHDMTCELIWKRILSENATRTALNRAQMIPVAHLRWLRWCPSGFSAHYITASGLGERILRMSLLPTCNSHSELCCFAIPKICCWKCMMICLEELWRLLLYLRQTESWQSYTHPVWVKWERIWVAINVILCMWICIRCKHWICLWFDASVCMNKSVWPLLCKTSVLFLFRWAVCVHA